MSTETELIIDKYCDQNSQINFDIGFNKIDKIRINYLKFTNYIDNVRQNYIKFRIFHKITNALIGEYYTYMSIGNYTSIAQVINELNIAITTRVGLSSSAHRFQTGVNPIVYERLNYLTQYAVEFYEMSKNLSRFLGWNQIAFT